MPKFIYETIPATENEKPEYFEIEQPEGAAPLTRHPVSGQPVRRVVIAGAGELKVQPADEGGCGCGPSGCCG
ncbi:MAG: zinc ribbon domain-containing protein [Verrucomicrobia bacterium]|nr:MAG: zinc ribbon domain-containing protein [Verrucomicrobiota bacterium]